jgi:hypothetical protein
MRVITQSERNFFFGFLRKYIIAEIKRACVFSEIYHPSYRERLLRDIAHHLLITYFITTDLTLPLALHSPPLMYSLP